MQPVYRRASPGPPLRVRGCDAGEGFCYTRMRGLAIPDDRCMRNPGACRTIDVCMCRVARTFSQSIYWSAAVVCWWSGSMHFARRSVRRMRFGRSSCWRLWCCRIICIVSGPLAHHRVIRAVFDASSCDCIDALDCLPVRRDGGPGAHPTMLPVLVLVLMR